MKIKVSLGIGFSSANRSDILEVDDNLTEDEIIECINDWSNNYIDIGWTIIKEE